MYENVQGTHALEPHFLYVRIHVSPVLYKQCGHHAVEMQGGICRDFNSPSYNGLQSYGGHSSIKLHLCTGW